MKRYISLLLILPLVIAAVVSPVSAAEANYNVINILDYDYILDFRYDGPDGSVPAQIERNFLVFDEPGSYSITFPMPLRMAGSFSFSAFVAFDGHLDWFGGDDFTLTETDYLPNSAGGDIYLLSGSVTNAYFSDESFTISLNILYGDCSMEFFNFNVIPYSGSTADTELQVFDVIRQNVTTVPAGIASYDYPVNVQYEESVDAADVSIRLRPLATEGTYDYFDLSFEVTGINVQSITCMQGDKALDFDVGFAYLDGSGNFIYGNNEDNLGIETNTFVRCWVSLRVYTPAANFINGWPLVFLDGVVINPWDDGNPPAIRFYKTQVSYRASVFDPLMYWIIRIAHSLNPDNFAQQEAFQNAVQEQVSEFDTIIDTMDSVQRPDLDQIQTDVQAVAPGLDILRATGPFRAMLSNELLLTVFSMSLLFCTGSYVLFGKKDF